MNSIYISSHTLMIVTKSQMCFVSVYILIVTDYGNDDEVFGYVVFLNTQETPELRVYTKTACLHQNCMALHRNSFHIYTHRATIVGHIIIYNRHAHSHGYGTHHTIQTYTQTIQMYTQPRLLDTRLLYTNDKH